MLRSQTLIDHLNSMLLLSLVDFASCCLYSLVGSNREHMCNGWQSSPPTRELEGEVSKKGERRSRED